MKKNEKQNKRNIVLALVFVLFIFLVIVGITFNKNLKGTHSIGASVSGYTGTGYMIEFTAVNGSSLYSAGYQSVPQSGICATDAYGFLDPGCAYAVACACKEWCTTKNCSTAALNSNQLYTYQFSSHHLAADNKQYYCKPNTLYSSSANCEVNEPASTCYECTVGSSKEHVETINKTRAAVMTGGTNCTAVEGAKCSITEATCYECNLGIGKEYTFSTSANGAAWTTGGNSCKVVESTHCCSRPTSCYACTVNGEIKYTYARAKTIAASELGGGTGCTIVDSSSCDNPDLKCFSCDLGAGDEYIYAPNESEAARKSGGTNCEQVSETSCKNTPDQCYQCSTSNGNKHIIANSATLAAESLSGTNCTVVDMTTCQETPQEPEPEIVATCYGCTLGEGEEYTYATSASEAAANTGGTNCLIIRTNYCDNPPTRCYSCTSSSGTINTTARSRSEAASKTDGSNCVVADPANCEITPPPVKPPENVPENPKTGSIAIIIAWIAGLLTLVYSCFYISKINKLRKNEQ